MSALSTHDPAAYYRLCAAAARAGVPVSLDDPASPRTVEALVDAYVLARQRAWQHGRGMGPFPLRAEILAEVCVADPREVVA